jgi:hypothetical protein
MRARMADTNHRVAGIGDQGSGTGDGPVGRVVRLLRKTATYRVRKGRQ